MKPFIEDLSDDVDTRSRNWLRAVVLCRSFIIRDMIASICTAIVKYNFYTAKHTLLAHSPALCFAPRRTLFSEARGILVGVQPEINNCTQLAVLAPTFLKIP
jgi:hypothetical protein